MLLDQGTCNAFGFQWNINGGNQHNIQILVHFLQIEFVDVIVHIQPIQYISKDMFQFRTSIFNSNICNYHLARQYIFHM